MSFKRKYLKDDPSVYFIAEIGINHNGRPDLAKKMIEKSKEMGASAVKFQKRHFASLLHPDRPVENPTGYLSQHENDLPDESKAFGTWSYPDKRLEFTDEQHLELWKYTESLDMDYIISPWEEESVRFLAKHGAKAIKLASIDANNYKFCDFVASFRIPTIVSTGMTSYDEMIRTWDIFQKHNCPIMFLHCTSSYPCPMEDKNLSCIPVIKELFGEEVGFSGHATGIEGSMAAVALGARVVEKHVSLNPKMSGPDQAASLSFESFGELIHLSQNIVKAMGSPLKKFQSSEETLHSVLSKRIVLKQSVRKGQELRMEDLDTRVIKGPGGLLPNRIYDVVGRKLKADMKEYHILEAGDYE
ncbi:MAG: N-acetylneuraminate synthase family protein [Deltaproteobacteria bacterium]|nr:N-acetylneuraminate synthase family protein [Deltaproteobacteria bacterium]